jgi:hypothetical protein
VRHLTNFDLKRPDLGPNFPIDRMMAKVLQIGVFSQPPEISIAQDESALKRSAGQFNTVSQRVAACEIVLNQWIFGTQLRQAFVDLQAIDIFATACVIVAENLQRFHPPWVSFDHALQETDLDIEVRAFLAGQLLSRGSFFRHTLWPK